MAYETRKGVPLPALLDNAHKYPFRTMEVGDSFALSGENRLRVASAASDANKRLAPKRFSIRQMDDGSLGCWRIK